MATILMRRRWMLIGHGTRQEASITKTTLHWRTPEGKRKMGQPKITWRRTMEKEMKQMGKTWSSIQVMAKDRQMWRDYVATLHTIRSNGNEWVTIFEPVLVVFLRFIKIIKSEMAQNLVDGFWKIMTSFLRHMTSSFHVTNL